MSHNLKDCLKDLKFVMKNKNSNKRKNQLEFLAHKKCIYDAMREISMNIINKNIPLNKSQVKRLNKYAKTMKTLAKGIKNKSKRKKYIEQTGGFLPWLLPIIATAITSAIELAK